MDFEIGQHSQAKMRLRRLYNNHYYLPSGTPTEWDKKLKEFDPELSLRCGHVSGRFLIFYDHHGELTTVHSFSRNESFGRAFLNVKHNSLMNSRALIQMRKDLDSAEQKRQDYLIDQCGEEVGVEVHNATKGRLINDNVDAFAPEKAGLGGVMI